MTRTSSQSDRMERTESVTEHRIKKRICRIGIGAGLLLLLFVLSGCGEDTRSFDQAGKDLEQGSYSYALSGYQDSIAQEVRSTLSMRGAGIACLRMGDYNKAVEYFTQALGQKDAEGSLRKDLLSYRATAFYSAEDYANAMADCQTLAEEFKNDAQTHFITGCVALAMDSYDEAQAEFNASYEMDPSYDNAIRIYEIYLDRGMEADGTKYLERSLKDNEGKGGSACDRGRIYYYMEDYDRAAQELIESSNDNNSEATLLLGMVYLARHDASNARAMYQQYIQNEPKRAAKGYNGLALCDVEEEKYDSALNNIQLGIPTATTEEMQSLLFNEIVIYEKMLDFASARMKAEEYLAMFPEDKKASRELTFLRNRTLS